MNEAEQRFHDQLQAVSPTLAMWLANRFKQGFSLQEAQDQIRRAMRVVEQERAK